MVCKVTSVNTLISLKYLSIHKLTVVTDAIIRDPVFKDHFPQKLSVAQ